MRECVRPDLSERTTLHLGGHAHLLLTLEQEDDFGLLSDRLKSLGLAALALGRGSNLLALDGELPLVLVENAVPLAPVASEEDERILLQVSSSLPLPALLAYCAEMGLSGLEGLSGIPGTVGGAIAMNAGSFGCETVRCLHSVTLWQKGCLRTIGQRDCSFGYRTFVFPGCEEFYLILYGVFALTRSSKERVRDLLRAHLATKKERQPISAQSAGCVFKNPSEGPSAGRLLEEAGFRGKNFGGLGFSAVHANFLVHHRGMAATSAEALALLRRARDTVAERTQIELEPEVRIVPWTPL